MNSRASGFSLVELMIVAALSAVVMGAIYETLLVQQKANRQINAVVTTQQTLRTSLQFLQGEFRELGTTTGDVSAAAPESVTIRALRKTGVICAKPNATTLAVLTLGQGGSFAANDSVLIFADMGDRGSTNDGIRLAIVGSPAAGGCTVPTGLPWDSMSMAAQTLSLTLVAGTLADVSKGAVVRSYDKVTYGIFQKGGRYVLGRRGGSPSDTVITLIGPLAPPAQDGLKLVYFDTANQALPTGTLSASDRQLIGRIQLNLRGSTPGASSATAPVYTDVLVTNIFLRGNT